jgi:hypothetical protein
VVRTFAIITTDANELVAEMHDRMPVIRARASDYVLWLGEEPDPPSLMRQFRADLMRMWRPPQALQNDPTQLAWRGCRLRADGIVFLQPWDRFDTLHSGGGDALPTPQMSLALGPHPTVDDSEVGAHLLRAPQLEGYRKPAPGLHVDSRQSCLPNQTKWGNYPSAAIERGAFRTLVYARSSQTDAQL